MMRERRGDEREDGISLDREVKEKRGDKGDKNWKVFPEHFCVTKRLGSKSQEWDAYK